jgi:formyltetrahydrofolate synthetase
MERRDEELIRQFLNHDDELRALYQEHQELKQKLENFRTKIYLSTEEELEKRRIQKLKLAHKDKMMELLHRHVQHEAH